MVRMGESGVDYVMLFMKKELCQRILIGILCFGSAGYVGAFLLWNLGDNVAGITIESRYFFVASLMMWGGVIPLVTKKALNTALFGSFTGFFSLWVLACAVGIKNYLSAGSTLTLGKTILTAIAFPVLAFHPLVLLGITLLAIFWTFVATMVYIFSVKVLQSRRQSQRHDKVANGSFAPLR